MSGIVLSASVRQNLLSLQSTADLLATTQNRLSTGKKVNSALDNPTNFFTAQGLDSRANDISNLLDSVSNGVQVLQAANTGISSLQKLVDSAKSVATQALQATVGYSTKSSVSTTIAGATADNLLGTGPKIDATFTGSPVTNNQTVVYSASTGTGTVLAASNRTAYTNTNATQGAQLYSANATNAPANTALSALTDSTGGAQGIAANETLTINGMTITFQAGSGALTNTAGSNYTFGIGNDLTALTAALNTLQGSGSSITLTGGRLTLATGTAADLAVTGTALTKLGLTTTAQTTQARGGGVLNASATTTATTRLGGAPVAGGADALTSPLTTSDYLIVNGKTITFNSGNSNTGSIAGNNLSFGLGSGNANGTLGDLLGFINQATGGSSSVDGSGRVTLTTSTSADISLSGSLAGTLTKLGLTTVAGAGVTRTAAATPAITGNTLLSGASSNASDSLTTAFAAGDTVSVNGQLLTFVASSASGNNQINIGDNVTTLLAKIDVLSGNTGGGAVPSTVTGGRVVLHTGAASDLTISSSNAAALSALGLTGGVSQARGTGPSTLSGQTLSIGATGIGGVATSITFGAGAGQVKTLNDLNTALSTNNLQATLAADGTLTITTANDSASATIGSLTGTATNAGNAFYNKTIGNPVVDAAASQARNNLVTQYNNILDQITKTSQDASFNGVNLLSGDTLSLTFNETGTSKLNIRGTNSNAAGLGLATLNPGDFKDNQSANKVIAGLSTASSALRAQASALGSNLSIVQIRQDFSKNLINVLQTGSSNLTLADTNEEAANSQALSTRQSIAVSALALANQSQQSVLQLLR